jgi:zinc D-Ala-D-Ala carboxypeptidase
MQISEHFTLEELCFSETAARLHLDNTPSAEVIASLRRVATAMEDIRARLGGRPVIVHSGYRSPDVNAAIGATPTSAHCRGLACDFVVPEFGTPAEVALAILHSNINFDQLILEYGWVHLGLAEEGTAPRREALTKPSPKAEYEPGICSR